MPTPNIGYSVVARQVKTVFAEDTFPVAEDVDLLGGLRVVATEADLATIPQSRQKAGMQAVTQDTNQTWQLQNPGPTPTWVNITGATEVDVTNINARAAAGSPNNGSIPTWTSTTTSLTVTNGYIVYDATSTPANLAYVVTAPTGTVVTVAPSANPTQFAPLVSYKGPLCLSQFGADTTATTACDSIVDAIKGIGYAIKFDAPYGKQGVKYLLAATHAVASFNQFLFDDGVQVNWSATNGSPFQIPLGQTDILFDKPHFYNLVTGTTNVPVISQIDSNGVTIRRIKSHYAPGYVCTSSAANYAAVVTPGRLNEGFWQSGETILVGWSRRVYGTGYTYICTAITTGICGSTPPTGTGSGIVNGGVTFAYCSTPTNTALLDKIEVYDAPGRAGIELNYCWHTLVENPVVQRCGHGVQHWGGDANPGANGALANERKCYDVRITQPECTDNLGGNCWGSMGEAVVVVGGVADRAGDVGVDFEGGFNCKATGYSARGNVNGNSTAFFYCKGVTFGEPTSVQDVDGGIHFRIYNSAQDTNNKLIEYLGGTMVNTVGIGVADNAYGPVERLKVLGVACENVKLNWYFLNQRYVDCTENNLNFTVASGSALIGIQSGGSTGGGITKIKDNTVISQVTQPAGSYGIASTQGDFNSNVYDHVEENTISGFPKDMLFTNSSANAGTAPVRSIKRNKLGATAVDFLDIGASIGVNYFEANEALGGNPWPSGKPTVGMWAIGCLIHMPVAASGYAFCLSYFTPTAAGGNSGAAQAWANSTTYVAGQGRYTAAGNTYICTKGGTSDASGAGPTGTGTGIPDGTAVWRYGGCTQAVFYGAGTQSASPI